MTLGRRRKLRPREEEAVDLTVHSKAGQGSKLGAVVGGTLVSRSYLCYIHLSPARWAWV